MLGSILNRLQTGLPTWAGVEIAEDIDALISRAGQVESRSAILMPWRERGGPQQLSTGGHRQHVEVQFAVGIVLRDYSGRMGEERALLFDELKGDLENVLAGWTPDGATDPCELVGGESSPITKGVSIYVTTWATARFLTGDLT